MSFLKYLSNDDIKKFLNANNISLATVYDSKGKKLPEIERENNAVFVRGKITISENDALDTLLKEYLFNRLPAFANENLSTYLNLSDTILLFIKDFEVKTLSDKNISLNKQWINFMTKTLQAKNAKLAKSYIAKLKSKNNEEETM